MSTIALLLWAACSNAAIQNSDFWFHDEGDTIFINGARGAPLHIDYIGAPLTKPLKVRVTPNNPKLKIAAPICTFTKKDDDCWLTVRLENGKQKVYGINHFTVTEVGASEGALKAQAASDTSTIGFGVGVQGKDMPEPLVIYMGHTITGDQTRIKPRRVVIINSTTKKRDYKIMIRQGTNYPPSKEFSLPPKALCYADWDIVPDDVKNNIGINNTPYGHESTIFSFARGDTTIGQSTIRDVTNPLDPIYNGPYLTGYRNISSCSAQGITDCASNKWGSWVVGLANFGATDMEGGVRSGQIEILRDNSWKNEAYIYYNSDWDGNNLDFIQIQGSTDGSENWDVQAATPSILDIKSAPPCSNFTTDPSVTFNVRLKIFGPGKITMPAGAQCQAFNIPPESFTNCTGSGSRNEWYEMTAVPEVGKTFAGWGSDGLCDDTKTTCRFQLTRDVGMRPGFY
jgi:hypothetical protein